MNNNIQAFLADQRGTTAIEYTVIVAVLSVVAIAAYAVIGGSVGAMMDSTAAAIAG